MRFLLSMVIGLVSVFMPLSALSHHSFSAEFDVGRPVDIVGSVIEVEWTNPHAWIHLNVENQSGGTEKWAVEMLGVNTLVRSGMTPQTLKAGDRLRITGFGSRDGTNTANASSVSRENGEALWSSARE